MDLPVANIFRTWAPPAYDFSDAGFPDPEGDEALDARVRWAGAYVAEVTGRPIATMPVELEPIAEQAITLRVLQMLSSGTTKALNVASAPWLKSFTAGSYREDRFSPKELGGGDKDVLLKVNPLMELAQLLWLLMTDEKRDYWLEVFGGRVKPAGRFIDMGFGHLHGESMGAYDDMGLVE